MNLNIVQQEALASFLLACEQDEQFHFEEKDGKLIVNGTLLDTDGEWDVGWKVAA